MDEKKIAFFMKTLDLTKEEAIALIEEDAKIDKMTSTKQIDSDLSADQKKAVKKAKNVTRAVDAYGKERKVSRKEDPDKRYLISIIKILLEGNGNGKISQVDVTKPEGQIDFVMDGRKFRIVLSAPRK